MKKTKNIWDMLKDEVIDFGENFQEYKEDVKKQTYRPKSFNEYIGQNKIKENLKCYIKGIKIRDRVFPHTLISGNSGMGKTTLAGIIAIELGVKFIECCASSIKDEEDILNKVTEVGGGVLFLDEIHSLKRDMAEKFYSIMEDFKLGNKYIKPMTLIGSTTEQGEILRDRKPFYNRFLNPIELNDYTIDDLIKIGKQYRERIFTDDEIPEEVYFIIADNSRMTPRNVIKLISSVIYFEGDIAKVLNNLSVIKHGFTEKDLKVLKYISLNERGVGLQGISSFLDTSEENYLYEIEPYLLKNYLIVRTARGRKITQKGEQFIGEIENE